MSELPEAISPPRLAEAERRVEAAWERSRLVWMVARELLRGSTADAAEHDAPDRVRSMADAQTCRCPVCGAWALIVGREQGSLDVARDPVCVTELLALCVQGPHLSQIESQRSYDFSSA